MTHNFVTKVPISIVTLFEEFEAERLSSVSSYEAKS